jgi:phospholipase C
VFQVRPGQGQTLPRTYTVEPGKHLVGVWAIEASAYDLTVHGPNGFLRSFQGVTAGRGHAQVDVRASTDEFRNSLALGLNNRADHEAEIKIVDRYTGETVEVELGPKASATRRWSVAKTSGWYDLVVSTERDADFQVQVAGHLENGQDSISDPALGGVKIED